MLQRREDSNTTSFTWDSNELRATGVDSNTKTNDSKHYNQYLQDELGSPIRFFSPNGDMEGIYSYDEFGQEGQVSQNQNTNFLQPFTYTGYQRDSVANTYYAQYYNPYLLYTRMEPTIEGIMSSYYKATNMRSPDVY